MLLNEFQNNPPVPSSVVGRPRFWRRQFCGDPTEAQKAFDVIAGILAPIACFVFDPIVFKGDSIFGQALLNDYQLFAYSVSAFQIVTLIGWFLFGARLGRTGRLVGGVLICGGIFSAVIGFVILPYTLIGLIVVIGVLGFFPFLTAIIYLRNGVRAMREANNSGWTAANVFGSLLLGSVLAVGLPAIDSIYITQTSHESVQSILSGTPQQAETAAHWLGRRWLIPQKELTRLRETYQATGDEGRRERIRNCYRWITGNEIDTDIEIRARMVD